MNTGDFSATSSGRNTLASIHGSRAANGVVFITTNKGKAGKARVKLQWMGGLDQNPKTT